MQLDVPRFVFLVSLLARSGGTHGGAAAATAPQPPPIRLGAHAVLEDTFAPGASPRYVVRLPRGGSAEIVVLQIGIDVVVELSGPAGTPLASFDSPNGRQGDEVVEIMAREKGDYVLRVRPISAAEPAGKIRVEVKQLRDASATRRLLDERRAARASAARWLRAHSTALPGSGALPAGVDMASLDELASRVRVLGIGEATHGSREFGDLRLSIVRELVERHDVRLIAVEGSATRLALLEPYVDGIAERDGAVTRRIESGWIGRRPLRELIEWLRGWNQKHPEDRVRLIGVDGQDSAEARAALREFLTRAYGERFVAGWEAIEPDLIENDAQAMVFGDSGSDPATRQLLLEIAAALELDAPILRARFGAEPYASARRSAQLLLQAADFNSGGESPLSHSRDWYMAVNLLGALEERAPGTRAVFWAHNAHVVHPPRTTRTSGALLRDVFGCGYGALAVTFGEGAFVAQVAGDPEHRLAVSELPRAPEDSVEGVLANVRPESSLVTWSCPTQPDDVPEWLRRPQRMHWVGGLWKPGSDAGEAFRAFSLVQDFDGIVYLRRVGAEDAM